MLAVNPETKSQPEEWGKAMTAHPHSNSCQSGTARPHLCSPTNRQDLFFELSLDAVVGYSSVRVCTLCILQIYIHYYVYIVIAAQNDQLCYKLIMGILQVISKFIQEPHSITCRIIKCSILDQKMISFYK